MNGAGEETLAALPGLCPVAVAGGWGIGGEGLRWYETGSSHASGGHCLPLRMLMAGGRERHASVWTEGGRECGRRDDGGVGPLGPAQANARGETEGEGRLPCNSVACNV